jgi:hypothetical protein
MAVANEAAEESQRVVLRIGINLGDVIVEGSDLYGDGVDIAARLEGIAEPGGILITGTAYDYVRNKLKVGFGDFGTQSLKNITEPVRTYRVTGTPIVAVAPSKLTGREAVYRRDNLGGNPKEQYFSDGITEDIVIELSRFRSPRLHQACFDPPLATHL